MKELWTSLASLMGVIAFLQTLIHAFIPPELRLAAANLAGAALNFLVSSSSYCYFDVTEIDGVSTNELYNAVHLYLSSSSSADSSSSTRLSLSRHLNSSAFTFGLAAADRVADSFDGASASWQHVVRPRHSQTLSWRPIPDETRSFTLRIKKSDRQRILRPYLEHIMRSAAELRRRSQDRLLYTNARGGSGGCGAVGIDGRGHPWEPVPFKHPSTFDTLAIDPSKKADIMRDLDDFAAGESFYKSIGRAWKRGYLLYGPPGTGKSSMIAAIANYLKYDVYDLELTEVHTNSELRKLLMKTTAKSIIVIEDIDCSVDLANRRRSPKSPKRNNSPDFGLMGNGMSEDSSSSKTITLSGLLNFTDGLWSCCGSERIFVFTTNHIERLDPALLRSGRMDMHIEMGYCSFPALRILMRNYLRLEEEEEEEFDGSLMRELAEAVDEAAMTPADVSEVLIRNRRREKREAMMALLEVLRGRKAGGGGSMEEEQEKRALESPKEEGGEAMERCNEDDNKGDD